MKRTPPCSIAEPGSPVFRSLALLALFSRLPSSLLPSSTTYSSLFIHTDPVCVYRVRYVDRCLAGVVGRVRFYLVWRRVFLQYAVALWRSLRDKPNLAVCASFRESSVRSFLVPFLLHSVADVRVAVVLTLVVFLSCLIPGKSRSLRGILRYEASSTGLWAGALSGLYKKDRKRWREREEKSQPAPLSRPVEKKNQAKRQGSLALPEAVSSLSALQLGTVEG